MCSSDLPDLPDHVSQAAYFVVSESLANLNKHSGATAAGVEARVVNGVLHVRISDNGIGGASTAKGHGLAGLVERGPPAPARPAAPDSPCRRSNST